jgi:hypothetical protein
MNKDIDTGGHAFPTTALAKDSYGDPVPFQEDGMTLRDYFAAMAMQGLLSGHWEGRSADEWAKSAYEIADAMIACRDNDTSTVMAIKMPEFVKCQICGANYPVGTKHSCYHAGGSNMPSGAES